MKFGEVPVADAEGAILAHSLKLGTTALKKARVLSRADLDLIAGAGLAQIVVARLEPGDVGEDEAARRVAAAAAGDEVEPAAPFTGRANLFAKTRGLLVFDRDAARPAEPRRRSDHPRHLAALCRGRAADDGRHGQDHPVRGTGGGRRALCRGGSLGRTAASRRTLPAALGGAHPDPPPRIEGEHPRQNPRGHRRAAEGARLPAGVRGTLRPCDGGAGGADPRRDGSRDRHSADPRSLGDPRSARRDPGGDRCRRWPDRPFRHAGRPGQSVAPRPARRARGARPSRLRALAQGQRLRLGAREACRRTCRSVQPRSCGWAAAACSPRSRRGHCRGPRRHPQPSANPRRDRKARGSGRCCWPPANRGGWADRTNFSPRSMALRWSRTLRRRLLASRARPIIAVLGNQADAVDSDPRQIAGRTGPQSRICGGAIDFAEARHRRAAVRSRRRDRVPRRHAADFRPPSRPSDRGVQPARRPRDHRPDPARQARQPGPLVEAVLSRDDRARRRCWGQASDRRTRRAGRRGRDGR